LGSGLSALLLFQKRNSKGVTSGDPVFGMTLINVLSRLDSQYCLHRNDLNDKTCRLGLHDLRIPLVYVP
jgi:hypothetical protein